MIFNKILTSRWFVVALSILLWNDFFLKSFFGNWITGKLSDFAGLFVFPLFLVAISPKNKNLIFWLVAVFFVFWKSDYSQPLIDNWNDFGILNIHRTVDYTDNIALLMLPVAFYFNNNLEKVSAFKLNPVFTLCVSVFAFVATSYRTTIPINEIYHLDFPLDTLKHKIYHLKHIDNSYQREKYLLDTTGKYLIHQYNRDTILVGQIPIDKFVKDTMKLFVYEDFCFKGYSAKIIISGNDKKSSLNLLSFEHSCPKDEKTLTTWKDDKKILSKSFKEKIITQLNNK